MKPIRWDPDKNAWLWANRGIGFELVVFKLGAGEVLDVIDHSSPRYSHQKIFVIELGKYVYLVPFVENAREIFLKTMIPSRQATKRYLGKAGDQ